jgi:hypothetical protein
MKTDNFTQGYIKSIFKYNPETGVFKWLYSGRGIKKYKDMVAGCKKTKYVYIKLNQVSVTAHRLAWLYMTGEYPVNEIDHIDGDGHNNKWNNLREATRSNNCLNSKRKNRYGIRGVRKNGKNGYSAEARINKKYYYLGTYPTVREAGKAYEQFAIENHLDFYVGLYR